MLFRLLLQLVNHFLFGYQGLLGLLELLLEIFQLQSLDMGDRELTEPHPAQPWRPGRPRASCCSWGGGPRGTKDGVLCKAWERQRRPERTAGVT